MAARGLNAGGATVIWRGHWMLPILAGDGVLIFGRASNALPFSFFRLRRRAATSFGSQNLMWHRSLLPPCHLEVSSDVLLTGGSIFSWAYRSKSCSAYNGTRPALLKIGPPPIVASFARVFRLTGNQLRVRYSDASLLVRLRFRGVVSSICFSRHLVAAIAG
jgi:hypothetical protein